MGVVQQVWQAVPDALLYSTYHVHSSYFAETANHVVNQAAVCGPGSGPAAVWSVCQQGALQACVVPAALCALQVRASYAKQVNALLPSHVYDWTNCLL